MNFQWLFKRNRYDVSGRDAFNRHLEWCFGIAVIFAFVILIKTGVVQLNELCKMQSKITKQNMVWDSLSMPLRGEIRDRNGVLMATSLPIQTVVMDPFRIRSLSQERRRRVFQLLKRILGVSYRDLERLSTRKIALIPVKRAVSIKVSSTIQSYKRRGMLPGIECVEEQVREYPWGDCATVILGLVRGSGDVLVDFVTNNKGFPRSRLKHRFPWYRYSSIGGATPQRGIGGVEEVFNRFLAGYSDRIRYNLDVNFNPMYGFSQIIEEGKEPYSMALSIDIHLQRFVSQLIQKKLIEKDAQLGMVLAMEAFSGEVFACYSASLNQGKMVCDDSRIFTSSFEPGSVAKPLLMLYAFELGVITKKDRFNCNVPTRIGNKVYTDEHQYTHSLSPREILAVSSDSGMAQIVKSIIENKGRQLPHDTVNFLKRCGLGRSISMTHTAIPKSRLPHPQAWTSITPSQISIGYEFEASPFHLVSLYAAFANGGWIMQPILVKKVLDKKNISVIKINKNKRRCFSGGHASRVYDYMKNVVAKGGTGYRAAMKGFQIAGKTGTARRLIKGKYSRRSHNSSFIGFLPIRDDFVMVIGVFFQDIKRGSDYGGAACAPLFREIAEYIVEEGIQ